MSNLEVRIVNLPPMRVACVNGFGEGPEGMAFEKMKTWAETHNLPGRSYRLFGYNNPDPSPGSPNYGYDVWITVDESVQVDGDARIIEFPGGLYAVTRIEVKDPRMTFRAHGKGWSSGWKVASIDMVDINGLEEHIGPLDEMGGEQPFTLDLHLPISE